ncbi:MAG TPA: Ig-like domain-containing protein, partial [Candidatus Dormibacteraeota bacterium]|nr:Ig-like domain-containing protein [Candidatus Dormibacteraeota bacterium]
MVVIAVGSGVGIYVYSQAHRPVQQPTARNGAAPTPATVGAQSVAESQQAVLLSVVSSKPADGTVGIAPDTSITLAFNLAVNPAAVKSFLTVQATNAGSPIAAGALSAGNTANEVVFKPSPKFDFGAS